MKLLRTAHIAQLLFLGKVRLKKACIVFLALFTTTLITGQGVGIGTSTPNAQLELESTLANRKIILYEGDVNDHQFHGFGVNFGLMRYQVAGLTNDHTFYAAVNGTSSTELLRIKGNGFVGIGINPTAQLQLANTVTNRKVVLWQGSENDHEYYGFGVNGGTLRYQIAGFTDSHVFYSALDGTLSQELLRIQGDGKVGIGTSTPHAQLQLANDIANRSIVLWEDFDNEHHFNGFGINPGSMRYQISNTTNSHVFYAAASNVLSNELLRIQGNGNVGIGNSNPHAPLHLTNGLAQRKIVISENADDGHQFFGFGLNAGVMRYQVASLSDDHVFYGASDVGQSAELMRIKGLGFVGIGTSTPNAPLQFSNTPANRKVVLSETANNDHQFSGLGINAGLIRYQAASTTTDHIFYAATSAANSNELVRVKGTGFVGIGNNPTNLLDVGSGRSGMHPSNLALYATKNTSTETESIAEFRHSTGAQGIALGWNTISAIGNIADQQLAFASKGSAPLIFRTAGSEKVRISPTGNVGIGTTTPNAPLQFSNASSNRKVVLSETANDDHQFSGLGINSGLMRYQVASTTTDHVFYAAANGTTSNELLRIKGTGMVRFPPELINRKLVLYQDGVDNDHQYSGFGINAGLMRYQVADVSNDHVFYAAVNSITSNEVLRIKGNGNLGVGIATPQSKVDIQSGTTRTGTHPTGLSLYVTGNLTAAGGGAEFRIHNSTQGIGIGSTTVYAAGTNADQDLTLAAKGTNGNLTFNTNATERMRITGAGNVGIGTTTPNAPLQFSNTNANRKVVLAETANNDHQYSGLGINAGALRYQAASTTTDHIFYAASNSTTSTELVRIKGNGIMRFTTALANRKIVIYEGTDNEHQYHGFGVNAGLMRYQVAATGNNHVFYAAANATTSNELLRISGFGNVGVNLSSPSNLIDIRQGAARTGSHPSQLGLYLTGDFGSGILAEFRHADGTIGVGIGHSKIYATGTNASHSMAIIAKGPAGSLMLEAGDVEVMRIAPGKFVGIGTQMPHAPLHFEGVFVNRKIVLYETTNNDHQFYGLGATSGTMRYQVDAAASSHVFYAATGAGASTELLRIKGNGKVGIAGVTNPNAELHLSNTPGNRKIILNEAVANDHQFSGFGFNTGIMRYQVAATGDNHVFYAGASASSSNELMRIKGGGNVTIAGVIETENMIAPTLLNGFFNTGSGNATAGYYKDKMGRVHLKGLVEHAADPHLLTVFNLPAGYRPTSGQQIFVTLSDSTVCQINIEADGDVVVVGGVIGGWVSLSGISFKAD